MSGVDPTDSMNVPRYEFLARQAMEGKPLDAYGSNTSIGEYVGAEVRFGSESLERETRQRGAHVKHHEDDVELDKRVMRADWERDHYAGTQQPETRINGRATEAVMNSTVLDDLAASEAKRVVRRLKLKNWMSANKRKIQGIALSAVAFTMFSNGIEDRPATQTNFAPFVATNGAWDFAYAGFAGAIGGPKDSLVGAVSGALDENPPEVPAKPTVQTDLKAECIEDPEVPGAYKWNTTGSNWPESIDSYDSGELPPEMRSPNEVCQNIPVGQIKVFQQNGRNFVLEGLAL